MEVEQFEIYEFLHRFAPFSDLPEESLKHVAQNVEVGYFKAGTQILNAGDEINELHVIRSGVVEVYRRSGELYNRLDEGDMFGQLGLLMHRQVRFPAKAIADALIYFIPASIFNDLFDNHEAFADYVEVEDRTRLRQAVSQNESANELMGSQIYPLVTREPVTLPVSATVQEAAGKMTQEGVSSLIITADDQPLSAGVGSGADSAPASVQTPRSSFSQSSRSSWVSDHVPLEDAENGHGMAGILTDRDLRTRVIAEGLPLNIPVAEVMSRDLVTINGSQYVFEALLSMLRNNLHHLPVLHRGRPHGMIAISDIVRYESQNSLFVVSRIFRQQSIAELESLAAESKASFVRMVNEDANSHMVGSAMAVIGRSFKQRLLELAEESLGPPPVPYCFLALGSMARDEQTMVTDQDNALVLDNSFEAEHHDEYFEKLASFVCDGLARCGYHYCTGDIMATNPKWRQPLKVWEEYFAHWIENPSPEFLLNSNIFFDLEGVYGNTGWADDLRALIRRRAKVNPRFLACMARNALNRTPPLGFFKTFVMEQDGKYRNSINLKRRGTAPLVDLIRVHALAIGSSARNSFERLDAIGETKKLPLVRSSDLRDALEFISMVRIRHQAREIEGGEEPDNSVEPETLSHFERRNLKDAFQILSNAQKFLRFHYHLNRSA